MDKALFSLDIESLAYGGDAVGHIDGRVIFIPGGVPGDRVSVRVLQDRGGFLRGEIVEMLEPSPDRVVPFCPLAHVCGGCQWQQARYETQIAWKRRIVAESLSRIGGLGDVPVEPCVPSPVPGDYRSVARYPVGREASRLIWGYYRARSHDIVPIDSCPIADQRINDLAAAFRRCVERMSPQPNLSELTFRASRFRSDQLCTLTLRSPFNAANLADALRSAVPELAGVVVRQPSNQRVRTEVYGNGWRHEEIVGRTFRIDERSFFQVHALQAEHLVSMVGDMLGAKASGRVIDAYGGVGLLSIGACDPQADIMLFDTGKAAVRDAVQNAAANGFTRFVAFTADADVGFEQAERADAIIIDPPRTGMSQKALHAALRANARTVVYVSCNPATLARDLSRLAVAGYEIRRVVPVDMFPQTYHIEAVAELVR